MCHRCLNRSITISCFLRNVSLNKTPTRHSPFTYLCGLYHYIEDVCALKYYILSCQSLSRSLCPVWDIYFWGFFVIFFFLKFNLKFSVLWIFVFCKCSKNMVIKSILLISYLICRLHTKERARERLFVNVSTKLCCVEIVCDRKQLQSNFHMTAKQIRQLSG